MSCSGCAFGDTADLHFNREKVAKELLRYRRKGPGSTTRGLRDGIALAGLNQGTLLDIGGGLGILSLELLDLGMNRAVVVDASSAYLEAGSGEAARRGHSASIEFVHGDFLVATGQVAPSTVVTLDRVVCCYPFYKPLLEQALQRAERGFAFSYPQRLLVREVGRAARECPEAVAKEAVSDVRASAVGNDSDDRTCGVQALKPPSVTIVVS